MCVPNHNALLSYAGLKIPAPSPYFALSPAASQLSSALDFHRSQFCDYRQLLGIRQYQALHAASSGLGPYAAAYLDPYTQYLYKGDPRARFVQEEPKPAHSYIGLIAMGILSSKDKKLVLSDIYQWILDNYPYFRTRGPGWRNSIRHNLSLNDCFIKSGRSANGKGHYWAVHPANVDDFSRGDFRRRRAQRKVRKHMGLSVPDDEEDSPSPSPNPISWAHGSNGGGQDGGGGGEGKDPNGEDCNNDNNNGGSEMEGVVGGGSVGGEEAATSGSGARGSEGVVVTGRGFLPLHAGLSPSSSSPSSSSSSAVAHVSKKRLFDVESLLAPDFPSVVVVPAKVRLLESAAATAAVAAVAASLTTAHRGHSDMDSTTASPEQRQGCLSDDDDDSDVDIEGEDGDEESYGAAEEGVVDKDGQAENEQLHHHRASVHHHRSSSSHSHHEEESEELSGAEDSEMKIKDASEHAEEQQQQQQQQQQHGHNHSHQHQHHASTSTSTSTPLSPSRLLLTSEPPSSSALDLSSSSSSPSPSSSSSSCAPSCSASSMMTSMSVMSAGVAQTLVLPRSLDASQRARWMGLGLGGLGGLAGLGGLGGLAGVGLAAPSAADMGFRRYSAFHAAGGGNPGLRGSLVAASPSSSSSSSSSASVAPFLHSVFAAARYPSLVPLGACSIGAGAGTATGNAPGAGAGVSDASGRGRADDASHGAGERV